MTGSRASGIVVWVALATAASCCAQAGPSERAQPTGAPVASVLGAPSSAAPAEPAPPAEPSLDVSGLTPYLDDPALSGAKASATAGKPAEAAAAVLRALEGAGASLDVHDRAGWAYLAGYLYESAGSVAQAKAAYAAAAQADSPVASMAKLELLEISVRGGQHAEAVRLASEIDREVVTDDRVDAATLESMIRTGRLDDAKPRIARLVGQGTKNGTWPALALRVAKALLAAPGAERARLAIEVCDAVRFDAPRGRGADDAEDLRRRALGVLPHDERKGHDAPDPATVVSRAERLVQSSQPKRAVPMLDRLVKGSVPESLSCRVAYARGKALAAVKRHSEASEELARAATACTGSAELPEVLFAAGKAALRQSDHDGARSLFGRIEAGFKDHRLADDARLEAARAAMEAGDAAGARRLLETMADDYPDGDVTGDGIFLRALEAVERGAWAEARRPLEVGLARPKERAYHRAGRFAYFLGRASVALGSKEEGRRLLEAAALDYPLGYYAALALARLDAAEPGAAGKLLSAALAKPAAKAPPELPRTAAAKKAIRAAIGVARAGDARAVEDVAARLGARDRSADAATLLFAARMLVLAGDTRRAHLLLRTASEWEPRSARFELDAMRDELPRGAWRPIWEAAYPRAFSKEVEHASAESGVPVALLYAVMREESAFAPDAVSTSDARGLFQAIPATGSRMARSLGIKYGPSTLFDPGHNARIGARYLRNLRARFTAAPALAVPAYNAGPGAPEAWLTDRPAWDFDLWVERIPYLETRNYTKRVLSSLLTYELLYEGPVLSETRALPLRL